MALDHQRDSHPPGVTVRDAHVTEFVEASRCLGNAFHDDPIASYLFPDERTRSPRFASFSKFVMGIMSRHGVITTNDPIQGAAIWQAPSPPRLSPVKTISAAIAMSACTKTAFFRAATLGQLTMKRHPPEPHWYLAMLGTEPEHQGQGIASALLRATLENGDRTGVPAYLESSKESNIPFYERHGFKVTGEIKVPRGPTLWLMIRAPL